MCAATSTRHISTHKVSKKHLPLYLNEFAWRFNHRHDPDIFRAVLAGC